MKLNLLGYLFLITSCCTNKEFFREKLDDGSTVFASTRICKNKQAPRWVIAVRSDQSIHLHDEYFIPATACDTFVKKIFTRKRVVILDLTNDPNPDYPLTEEDKIIFKKMEPFFSESNKCYSNFISTATGYKLFVDHKR